MLYQMLYRSFDEQAISRSCVSLLAAA